MFLILQKAQLTEQVTMMIIHAPFVVKHAKPGQFVMIRVHENGERIPLTIADIDIHQESITIIFQIVGATTYLLNLLNEGDYILDVAGPMGNPTLLENYQKVLVIGGGVGSAIAYPIVKDLYQKNRHVDVILGFRNASFVFLETSFKTYSNAFYLLTDDGSKGLKGLVTDQLKKLLESKEKYDLVIAIGPLPMMKYVSMMTKPYGIKTIVSMNPIMVDGTGMCGGCRVMVDGTMKFACVDGPDFDGHLVDFDDAIRRNKMYQKQEENQRHTCKLTGENYVK